MSHDIYQGALGSIGENRNILFALSGRIHSRWTLCHDPEGNRWVSSDTLFPIHCTTSDQGHREQAVAPTSPNSCSSASRQAVWVVPPRPGWLLSFQDLNVQPTASRGCFISYWQAEVENYVCVREITKLGSSVPYQLIFFIIGAQPWLVISQTHTRRLACISLNAGPRPSPKAVLRQ